MAISKDDPMNDLIKILKKQSNSIDDFNSNISKNITIMQGNSKNSLTETMGMSKKIDSLSKAFSTLRTDYINNEEEKKPEVQRQLEEARETNTILGRIESLIRLQVHYQQLGIRDGARRDRKIREEKRRGVTERRKQLGSGKSGGRSGRRGSGGISENIGEIFGGVALGELAAAWYQKKGPGLAQFWHKKKVADPNFKKFNKKGNVDYKIDYGDTKEDNEIIFYTDKDKEGNARKRRVVLGDTASPSQVSLTDVENTLGASIIDATKDEKRRVVLENARKSLRKDVELITGAFGGAATPDYMLQKKIADSRGGISGKFGNMTGSILGMLPFGTEIRKTLSEVSEVSGVEMQSEIVGQYNEVGTGNKTDDYASSTEADARFNFNEIADNTRDAATYIELLYGLLKRGKIGLATPQSTGSQFVESYMGSKTYAKLTSEAIKGKWSGGGMKGVFSGKNTFTPNDVEKLMENPKMAKTLLGDEVAEMFLAGKLKYNQSTGSLTGAVQKFRVKSGINPNTIGGPSTSEFKFDSDGHLLVHDEKTFVEKESDDRRSFVANRRREEWQDRIVESTGDGAGRSPFAESISKLTKSMKNLVSSFSPGGGSSISTLITGAVLAVGGAIALFWEDIKIWFDEFWKKIKVWFSAKLKEWKEWRPWNWNTDESNDSDSIDGFTKYKQQALDDGYSKESLLTEPEWKEAGNPMTGEISDWQSIQEKRRDAAKKFRFIEGESSPTVEDIEAMSRSLSPAASVDVGIIDSMYPNQKLNDPGDPTINPGQFNMGVVDASDNSSSHIQIVNPAAAGAPIPLHAQ